MLNFNEHGDFEVACDGQIIFYKIIGSWNEQASAKCIAQLDKCFLQNDEQPIIMLVDTQGFEGGTLEGYELWRKAAQHWYQNNLSAFIRIDDPKSIHYKLFVEKQDQVLKQILSFQFSPTLKQAIKTANDLGFKGCPKT
jgi:hypothetical protein